MGTRREVSNPAVTGWIRAVSATAAWTTSVCTGALLLHEAGPARGRRVATHYAFEDTLQERGDITVIRDARYVVDGTWSPARACQPASTWRCGSQEPCTAAITRARSAATSSTSLPRRTWPTSRR